MKTRIEQLNLFLSTLNSRELAFVELHNGNQLEVNTANGRTFIVVIGADKNSFDLFVPARERAL